MSLAPSPVSAKWLRVVLLGASAVLAAGGQYVAAAVVALAAVVGLLVVLIGRSRWRTAVAMELPVLLLLVTIAGMAAGGNWGYFDRYWWWDVLLHGAAGFAVGVAGALLPGVLYPAARSGRRAALLAAVFAIALALGVGALWEVLEFAFGLASGHDVQSGLADTMWDLVVDGAGGAVAAVIAFRAARRGLRVL